MSLEFTFPTGVQQWHCPICARRTVMQYPLANRRFKMVVLEAGDEAVVHTTGGADLRIASAAARQSDAPAGPEPHGGVLH